MSKTRIIESTKSLDLPSIKSLLIAKPALLDVKDRTDRNPLHMEQYLSALQAV